MPIYRTVISLLLAALSLSGMAQITGHSKEEVEAALVELDSVVTHKKDYQNQCRMRADSLENMVAACPISEYIDKCKELYDELDDYDGRRALKVLDMFEQTPEYKNDPNFYAWVNLNRSRIYGIMGLYHKATAITNTTDPAKLSNEEQLHYYITCQSNYSKIFDYTSDISTMTNEEKQMAAYYDSIIALQPEGLERSIMTARKEVLLGHPQRAWEAIQVVAAQAQGSEIPELYPIKAEILGQNKQMQERIYYLTLEALEDLRSGKTHYSALPDLVMALYDEGQIDRAYKYLTSLMEDANTYPSRSLVLDVSRYFPLINADYTNHHEYLVLSDKERRNSVIVTVALLLLSIGVAIYLGWRQNNAAQEKRRANELQKALDQATIAERIKTSFIQNMRHEIRTPLNSIVGFAQLMSNDLSDEDRALYNGYIQESNDKLLATLDAIIDVSDMEVGTFNFKFEDIDIDELCKECIAQTREQLLSGVDLVYEPVKTGLHFISDRKRISQAITHLLSNSCKNTTSGTIVLSVNRNRDTDDIEFIVTDTGCGIPAEKVNIIFEHFEKIDHYSPGLGLGLYVCQLISHALGGDITLDTTYNGGARFILNVPSHDSEEDIKSNSELA